MSIDNFKRKMYFSSLRKLAEKEQILTANEEYSTEHPHESMLVLHTIFSDSKFKELAFGEDSEIDDELERKILSFMDFEKAGVLRNFARENKVSYKSAFSDIFNEVILAIEKTSS